MALERFDGRKPVDELSFCNMAFWIQIHDLPFSLLTREVTLSLGEMLGTVIKPEDNSDLQGGNFVWVCVVVDTSKTLSRVQQVSWDQDKHAYPRVESDRVLGSPALNLLDQVIKNWT